VKKFLLLSIQFLILLTFSAHAVIDGEEQKSDAATGAEATCEGNLSHIKFRSVSVNETLASATSLPVSSVIQLAKDHPLMVMSADQTIWATIKRGGFRTVLNPHYRAEKVRLWNVFSAGAPEAGNRRIIGQMDAVQTFVNWIRGRAEGRTDSGMLIYVGPGGTGKTFFANIITAIIGTLNRDNPDFYRYSYKWTDKVGEIAELRELVSNGRVNLPSSGRSPITLFPESIQQKIYAQAHKKGKEMLGFDPTPKMGPHIQTQEILNQIIQHEAAKTGKTIEQIFADEQLYYQTLDPYVKIVRVYSSANMVSPVVRYPGDKLPDLGSMFAGKDFERHMTYKGHSPLSFNYNGSVTLADGSILATDEVLRWPQDILNILLEVSENGVVQISGMPGLQVDVAMIGATNDESVEKATENGSIKAFKDRSTFYPMRYALHPIEIAETTLVMMSKENKSLFLMRKLNGPNQEPGELEPFDYDKVYPLPGEDGLLKGPDGRYSIYIRNGTDEPMLVAPRALTMLGVIAGATHMVKDESKLEQHSSELDTLMTRNIYFSDIVTRMKILIGDLRAEKDAAVRLELSRWQKIGKEGSSGISNRDTQRWLSLALSDARDSGETALTPMRMHKAFVKLLDTNGFTESGAVSKADWMARANDVRAGLLLPYILTDVLNILKGGSGEAERLYDDVKGEIIAMSGNPNATVWDRNGESVAIRADRFNAINKIYFDSFQKQLMPQTIINYHAKYSDGTRDAELLDAIRKYLLNKDFDTAIYGEVIQYFKGESVSQKTREIGLTAEKALIGYGYNRDSFVQALNFVNQMEIMAKRQKPQQ